MHKSTTPKALCVLKCWALMPSSAKDVCKGKTNQTEIFFLYFTVDKLQFEPPLRKETEAHSEMVIIMFSLINTNIQALRSVSDELV